jgi:hypothetical protein
MMALVAVVTFVMQSAITAYHVQYDLGCKWIRHVWMRIDEPTGPPRLLAGECVAPFWPQFWRKVLRQPWPGTFRCECWEGERRFGMESRPHLCISSRAVDREEACEIQACHQSLKSIGLAPVANPSQSALTGR